MSGGSGGPIIINTLTFSDPSKLPEPTVARLRQIAAKAREGHRLSVTDRLFVARTAFVYLGSYG